MQVNDSEMFVNRIWTTETDIELIIANTPIADFQKEFLRKDSLTLEETVCIGISMFVKQRKNKTKAKATKQRTQKKNKISLSAII